MGEEAILKGEPFVDHPETSRRKGYSPKPLVPAAGAIRKRRRGE